MCVVSRLVRRQRAAAALTSPDTTLHFALPLPSHGSDSLPKWNSCKQVISSLHTSHTGLVTTHSTLQLPTQAACYRDLTASPQLPVNSGHSLLTANPHPQYCCRSAELPFSSPLSLELSYIWMFTQSIPTFPLHTSHHHSPSNRQYLMTLATLTTQN